MLDGYHYSVEPRQGKHYRASDVPSIEKSEHPADSAIQSIAAIPDEHYPLGNR